MSLQAEVDSGQLLGEARALRTPKVVAVSAPDDPQQFLVLELVATGAPARDFDEKLGRGLAALHRHGLHHTGQAAWVVPLALSVVHVDHWLACVGSAIFWA